MLSNDSAEPLPQDSPLRDTGAPVAVLDPQSPIEVATTGNGTVNDPGGTDNKPPGFGDQDPLSLLA